MANVPIVTEVTKAELDALVAADGLNEGLQYKVTDKGWLLLANSGNTLISLPGFLTVTINEWIPDYISCNNILMESGLIGLADADENNGVPFLFEVKSGHYLNGCYFNDGDSIEINTVVKILDDADNLLITRTLQYDLQFVPNISSDTNAQLIVANKYYRLSTNNAPQNSVVRCILDLIKAKI